MTELLHGDLTYKIIGSAMDVHTELGPGFLESIYQRALEAELRRRGLSYESQRRINLAYKGEPIGDHVLDLVVDGSVVVELKAVSLDHKRVLLSDALANPRNPRNPL